MDYFSLNKIFCGSPKDEREKTTLVGAEAFIEQDYYKSSTLWNGWTQSSVEHRLTLTLVGDTDTYMQGSV